MDRESRNLGHSKANKLKFIHRPPLPTEGSPGDMQMYNQRLYIKSESNIWYSFSSDQYAVSHTPVFAVEMDANQTSIGTTLTKVEFDTILMDTRDGFNTSDNSYHVPEGEGGYYLIGSDIIADCSAEGNFVEIELNQAHADGRPVEVWQGFSTGDGVTAGQSIGASKNAIFHADSGSVFFVKAATQANGGGTMDINYESKCIFYGFKVN